MCHVFYPQQRVSGSAVPAACRRRRDWLPMGRPGIAAVWRRRCRCSPAGYAVPTARGKRGQGHRMVPLPPLDSPKPSFALTHRRCAAKRGLRGLGSGRRFAFGTLSGPEFTLRKPQRCQCAARQCRARTPSLRKAPLRSRVYSWSTKRPCGPLAFRRATEGSRVLRKVRGVKRGQETMFGVLSPFVSAGRPRHPRPPKAATVRTLTLSVKSPPAASRCIGGTAYPLLRVKKEERSSPPTAKIKPFSPASAPQRISRSVCRSDTQHPSAQWFRRASVRRSMQ